MIELKWPININIALFQFHSFRWCMSIDQLSDVAINGSVFLEYLSMVEIALLATSRHPAAKDTAFHVAKAPLRSDLGAGIYSSIPFTFYFHPVNPWQARFDLYLGQLHSAGIWREEFKRAKYKEKPFSPLSPPL